MESRVKTQNEQKQIISIIYIPIMSKDQNSVPRPNKKDKAYKLVKVVIAAATTGGSVLTGFPLSALAI